MSRRLSSDTRCPQCLPDDPAARERDRCPEHTVVRRDPLRGHISVGDATFADLGPTLHLWSYGGAVLTPATAKALGEALLTWAEHKQDG